MGFEAKHKSCKDNFKNIEYITKLLTKKYQMAIAYQLETFTLKGKECGQ